MKRVLSLSLLAVAGIAFAPGASAQADAEGCKDHPLFNRLPSFHLIACEQAEFDRRVFPVGPLKDVGGELRPGAEAVEGAVTTLSYGLKEGATPVSELQVQRNFEAAARKAGASIVGQYPAECQGMLDESLGLGNGCINSGITMKFQRGNREIWAYAQGNGSGDEYQLVLTEREAMKQDIAANDLLDKLQRDGFVALYINFDTGKATIKPDSQPTLDQVAQMLKSAPQLKIEVGGHTDNVGTPEANQALSEARARSVVAALTGRGIAADRLSAKGYGQTAPVADNRSEDGRAKNRRVELVKR